MNWEDWQRQERVVVLDVSNVDAKLKLIEDYYNWEEVDFMENRLMYRIWSW